MTRTPTRRRGLRRRRTIWVAKVQFGWTGTSLAATRRLWRRKATETLPVHRADSSSDFAPFRRPVVVKT